MGDRLGIRGAVDILSQVELTSSSMMNLLIIEANIFIILELMCHEGRSVGVGPAVWRSAGLQCYLLCERCRPRQVSEVQQLQRARPGRPAVL